MNLAMQFQQAMLRQRQVFDMCLAAWEALRRFGFKPEEIAFTHFDSLNPGGPGAPPGLPVARVGLTLNAQGKEFWIDVGERAPMALISDAELVAMWGEHAGRWGRGGYSVAQQTKIWNEYMPVQTFLDLALTLRKRGFTFPDPSIESKFRGVSIGN